MSILEKVVLAEGETYKPSRPYLAKVVENRRLTPETSQDDIRHIVLEIQGSGITYREGQSIGVVPPGTREGGKPNRVRLYSIASSRKGDRQDCTTVSLCIKRVYYMDEEGKQQAGLASNYICDLPPDSEVMITGPIGRKFLLPADNRVPLIMVAVGTGIAPFRSFIKHIYEEHKEWMACVRLFYGAKTGMETLYMNDENNDIGQYYTEGTFQAFQALSRQNPEEKAYVQDKIMAAKEKLWPLFKSGDFCFYLCGVKDLERGIEQILTGWAKEEGLDWEVLQKQYKDEGRWNIEVY